MSAFSPKSASALRVEAAVAKTLHDILADGGYEGAEIVLPTVRVLTKDVLEVVFHIGPDCWTAEVCCSAKKVLNIEPGMPVH